MESSTVAAISTPGGVGGIGIIKVSGPRAYRIGKTIFKEAHRLADPRKGTQPVSLPVFDPTSHRFYYGYIVDPEHQHILDEVLVVFMKAPRTYTREDVLEIHTHSGPAAMQAVLELILSNGGELAAPGEFTRRAFVNGRIDLTQAEAVMDIINARSRSALDIAVVQVKGELKQILNKCAETLLDSLARCEGAIDFPEDMEDAVDRTRLVEGLRKTVEGPLSTLLRNYNDGHVIREGLRLAIIGRPNVGKSSLMNRLLSKERVIVTEIPGTTRDIIEESVVINGITVILTDTAGLHYTHDPVEAIGIKWTEDHIAKADIVLFLVDASVETGDEDHRIFEKIRQKKHIVVKNKMDLVDRPLPEAVWETGNQNTQLAISVLENRGIDRLKRMIARMATEKAGPGGEAKIVPNLRQKQLIEKSLACVSAAVAGIQDGTDIELIVLDLKEGLAAIEEILGTRIREDLYDRIFDRFCIGK